MPTYVTMSYISGIIKYFIGFFKIELNLYHTSISYLYLQSSSLIAHIYFKDSWQMPTIQCILINDRNHLKIEGLLRSVYHVCPKMRTED